MKRLAVFFDDVARAQMLLAPLLEQPAEQAEWLMVACPPRLTQHAGRWITRANRDSWRRQWMAQRRAELQPLLAASANQPRLQWLLANRPPADMAQRLLARHGAQMSLLDVRRRPLGAAHDPLLQPPGAQPQWSTPVATAAVLSALMAAAD